MKDFIITLVCAGVASGMIGLFFEDDREIMKYIKAVLSLCLAASVMPAVFGFSAKIKEGDYLREIEDGQMQDFQNKYYEYVLDDAKEKLCRELEQRIFEKTGINTDSVNIQFGMEEREDQILVDIKSIEITVGNSCDKNAVKECVYDALGITPQVLSEKERGSSQ